MGVLTQCSSNVGPAPYAVGLFKCYLCTTVWNNYDKKRLHKITWRMFEYITLGTLLQPLYTRSYVFNIFIGCWLIHWRLTYICTCDTVHIRTYLLYYCKLRHRVVLAFVISFISAETEVHDTCMSGSRQCRYYNNIYYDFFINRHNKIVNVHLTDFQKMIILKCCRASVFFLCMYVSCFTILLLECIEYLHYNIIYT